MPAPKDFNRTPDEIVAELNKHIIAQDDAKRSLAIALRDRWRRQSLQNDDLRKEVTPNNILLIGPSGCGKTELAKRLAAFAGAPFVKVVATRYTEVGFVGDDTVSMVHELAEQSYMDEKRRMKDLVMDQAKTRAKNELIKAIMKNPLSDTWTESLISEYLDDGRLNEMEVELDAELLTRDEPQKSPLADIFGNMAGGPGGGMGGGRPGGISAVPIGVSVQGPNASDINSKLEDLFGTGGRKSKKKGEKKKVKVAEARPLLEDHYANELINEEDLTENARVAAEQRGIIFIDEFDKLITDKQENEGGYKGKRKGVQKELLTLMEGTTVSTKIGRLRTDHVLFVASGAFTQSKPTDIMPELQGRLPIRCELKPLTEADFIKILKETRYNLLMQQEALLATEGVSLKFSDDGINEIAKIAHTLNTETANVGARRLKTVMAKLLEDLKFDAHKMTGKTVEVTADMVKEKLATMTKQSDLSKYII